MCLLFRFELSGKEGCRSQEASFAGRRRSGSEGASLLFFFNSGRMVLKPKLSKQSACRLGREGAAPYSM